jgi:hypothetical protein
MDSKKRIMHLSGYKQKKYIFYLYGKLGIGNDKKQWIEPKR